LVEFYQDILLKLTLKIMIKTQNVFHFRFFSLTCFEKDRVVTWPGREEDSTQTVDPVAAHTTHTEVVALKRKKEKRRNVK
jgi:hypothetical protein